MSESTLIDLEAMLKDTEQLLGERKRFDETRGAFIGVDFPKEKLKDQNIRKIKARIDFLVEEYGYELKKTEGDYRFFGRNPDRVGGTWQNNVLVENEGKLAYIPTVSNKELKKFAETYWAVDNNNFAIYGPKPAIGLSLMFSPLVLGLAGGLFGAAELGAPDPIPPLCGVGALLVTGAFEILAQSNRRNKMKLRYERDYKHNLCYDKEALRKAFKGEPEPQEIKSEPKQQDEQQETEQKDNAEEDVVLGVEEKFPDADFN